MVSQGLTVFVISWANPDERHRHLDWGDYMKMGILTAADVAREITGEPSVHAIGIASVAPCSRRRWHGSASSRMIASRMPPC